MKAIAHAAAAVASQASRQPSAPNLPARAPVDTAPLAHDPVCDIELPRRLFNRWKVDGEAQTICRALGDGERTLLNQRKTDLEAGLQPFAPSQEDRVAAALTDMFGGFRSMRQDIAEAAAITENTKRKLEIFPAWAIEQACLKIGRHGYAKTENGRTWMEKNWPPNDAQVFHVVEDVVRPYRDALASAQALLGARVET